MSKEQEYHLVVNDNPKPWPCEDYHNEPITIDLNWGLDSTCYEAPVVTFVLKDLLNGEKVSRVHLDRDRKTVYCRIPIEKKIKTLKVVIDWGKVLKYADNNLYWRVANEQVKRVTDNKIVVVGESLKNPISVIFNGKSYPTEINDNVLYVKLNDDIFRTKMDLEYKDKCRSLEREYEEMRYDNIHHGYKGFVLGVIVGVFVTMVISVILYFFIL